MAERPTPPSIAIATLIALYIDPLSPLQEALNVSNGDRNNSSTTTKLLLLPLQQLVRFPHHESTTLTTMLQLFNNANDGIENSISISSILLETMQAVSASVDGLVDLMISIEAAALDHSDGEFGIFCRKVCLGFDQLPFESMTRLWEALRDEVEACTSNVGGGGEEEQQTTTTSHWTLSPQQKQDLLRLQCLTLDEAVATRSPEELSSQVSSLFLEEGQNEIPASHFLQFLVHLQRGSKVGALDALHRYFDYAMIAERKAESFTASSSNASTKGKRRRQVVLHYATLLLAAVHYEFGNVELSQTATQEAINVAQQSGDPACVAHALSFLHLTSTDDAHKQDVLQRCAVRALQGKLRRLVAGANLTVAQEGAASAASSWESVVNSTTDQPSSSLSMLHGVAITMDQPTHIEDLPSPAEAMEILGQTTLVAASIWERMGIPSLSSLTTEIGLECYDAYLTTATKDAAHQSVARKALAGGPLFLYAEKNNPKNNDICRYGIALLRLKHAGTAFGTIRLLHEWAVRRGEYGHAQALLDYLYSRLHPRLPNFTACQIEVAAQHAFLLARQGWAQEAKMKYQDLVDSSEKEGNFVQQAHFLIQLAVTLLDANKQEFRAAVRPLRACLKLTTEHTMDVWHAMATSIMAQVHYRMTKTDSAIAMIKGVLPTLRQHTHDVWFVGEAYMTMAKCYMKREKMVAEAMDALDKSGSYFLKCQDLVRLREVYFWQARLHSLKKDFKQREETSERFVHVSQQLAKGTIRTGLGKIEDPDYMELMARRQVHG